MMQKMDLQWLNFTLTHIEASRKNSHALILVEIQASGNQKVKK